MSKGNGEDGAAGTPAGRAVLVADASAAMRAT
jgi:hypothetical protein